MKLPEIETHQNGEPSKPIKKSICALIEDEKLAVDTFGGRVHVERPSPFAVFVNKDVASTLKKSTSLPHPY